MAAGSPIGEMGDKGGGGMGSDLGPAERPSDGTMDITAPEIETKYLKDAFLEAAGEIFDCLDTHRRGRIDMESAAIFFALSIRKDKKMPSRERALLVAEKSLGGADGSGLAEGLTRPGFLLAYWNSLSKELPTHILADDAERRVLMVRAMKDGLAAVLVASMGDYPSKKHVARAMITGYDCLYDVLSAGSKADAPLTRLEVRAFLRLAVFPVLFSTTPSTEEVVTEHSADFPDTDGKISREQWRIGCETLRQATEMREVLFLGLCVGTFATVLSSNRSLYTVGDLDHEHVA